MRTADNPMIKYEKPGIDKKRNKKVHKKVKRKSECAESEKTVKCISVCDSEDETALLADTTQLL